MDSNDPGPITDSPTWRTQTTRERDKEDSQNHGEQNHGAVARVDQSLPPRLRVRPSLAFTPDLSCGIPSGQGLPGVFFPRKPRLLSRQGHPIIAHRFNGGRAFPANRPVPSGTADACENRGHHAGDGGATAPVSVAPAGAWGRESSVDPPMNRWAIFGCP